MSMHFSSTHLVSLGEQGMRLYAAAVSLLLFPIFFFANTSYALSLAGVKLADKVKLGDKELLLNGAGIRKATIFRVKVYVAGLYLEQKSSNSEVVVADPGYKQLEMHFVRDVGGEKLRNGWTEGFQKNTKEIATIEEQITVFNSWMNDIEEGQSIILAFEGDAVTVNFANQRKGTIRGKEFCAALLRIWLGDNPPNEDLKDGLLGLS